MQPNPSMYAHGPRCYAPGSALVYATGSTPLDTVSWYVLLWFRPLKHVEACGPTQFMIWWNNFLQPSYACGGNTCASGLAEHVAKVSCGGLEDVSEDFSSTRAAECGSWWKLICLKIVDPETMKEVAEGHWRTNKNMETITWKQGVGLVGFILFN